MDSSTPTFPMSLEDRAPELARCWDIAEIDRFLLEVGVVPSIQPVVPPLPRKILLHLLDFVVVFWTGGQTPATRALGLAFTSRNSYLKKRLAFSLYLLLRCGLPILSTVLEDHWNPGSSLSLPSRARQRQIWLRDHLLILPRRVLPVLRWITAMLCWSGHLTSPCLATALSGCGIVAGNGNNSTPQVSFAHRRWIFELAWRTAVLYSTVWRKSADLLPRTSSWGMSKPSTSHLCSICHKPPLQSMQCQSCGQSHCYVCTFECKERNR